MTTEFAKLIAGAGSVQLRAMAARWSLASASLAMESWCLIERLLLVDLGVEQVAEAALRLVLALDSRGHELVKGGRRADARPCGLKAEIGISTR